jgi:hypothetical protein
LNYAFEAGNIEEKVYSGSGESIIPFYLQFPIYSVEMDSYLEIWY